MKQITLNIPDSKFGAFMQAIKKFSFVTIAEKKEIKISSEQKKIINDLKEALQDVELHEQGKIKLKPLDKLLDEL